MESSRWRKLSSAISKDQAENEWTRLATPASTDSSSSDAPAGGASELGDTLNDLEVPKVQAWGRQESDSSLATSAQQYAEPGQTLIFFDWDDTLFPYTAIFEQWRIGRHGSKPPPLPEELETELAAWREALYQYLAVACSLTDCCTIVTNAKRPWVDYCVDRFAPNLRPLLDGRTGGPTVVYAGEMLPPRESKLSRGAGSGLKLLAKYEDRSKQLTAGKLAAMRNEATRFYSRYPEQTWKNILSLGDMKYEHDAVHELTSTRKSPPRERLRTKAILLPRRPSLSELTLRLKFSRLMLPAYVRFNGDIDLDLRTAADPLQAIARALSIPQLGDLSFPRHAWGRTPVPEEKVATDALDEVAPGGRVAALAATALGGSLGAAQGDLIDFVHSAYTLAVSFFALTTLHERQELT
eukprot:CAMPEP_0195148958 /NCGR_PEP_ID=MMETSP0448-20130528/176206_1 /TAXON_ID=66468 /ORGANISM="Heterocapsa triquestra, Strain CCMP 448" /LENGTH=409 /DNA_ID=CAMNT_0040187585 /DNA_START=12 /DNA_END=1238 /DNA_ORIENTATION=+